MYCTDGGNKEEKDEDEEDEENVCMSLWLFSFVSDELQPEALFLAAF